MKVITLLTDFGLKDNFVAVMKGVILKINPKVNIVDISHNIKPQNTLEAAFLLKSTYRFFPKGTIHLVVVDPGVGTDRKAIIIKTKNFIFVGPDNGVLAPATKDDGIKKITEITNKKYFLRPISDTFHGRDIFAPISAWLSRNIKLNNLGKELNKMKELDIPKPRLTKNTLIGQIIYIDRFGNLITNIDRDTFREFVKNKKFDIFLKKICMDNISQSYAQVKRFAPLAIFGSFGNLEISINEGNAQRKLKAKITDKVKICRC